MKKLLVAVLTLGLVLTGCNSKDIYKDTISKAEDNGYKTQEIKDGMLVSIKGTEMMIGVSETNDLAYIHDGDFRLTVLLEEDGTIEIKNATNSYTCNIKESGDCNATGESGYELIEEAFSIVGIDIEDYGYEFE